MPAAKKTTTKKSSAATGARKAAQTRKENELREKRRNQMGAVLLFAIARDKRQRTALIQQANHRFHLPECNGKLFTKGFLDRHTYLH